MQLYSDGTAFFPVMQNDLRTANSSIHIMMFGLTPGTIADAIVSAPEEHTAAGVEIRMVVDSYGAKVSVADDAVIIGTINYDAWALYRNLEIGLLVEDAGVADPAIAELILPDIERSSAGVSDSDTLASIRNWVWDKLTYLLGIAARFWGCLEPDDRCEAHQAVLRPLENEVKVLAPV